MLYYAKMREREGKSPFMIAFIQGIISPDTATNYPRVVSSHTQSRQKKTKKKKKKINHSPSYLGYAQGEEICRRVKHKKKRKNQGLRNHHSGIFEAVNQEREAGLTSFLLILRGLLLQEPWPVLQAASGSKQKGSAARRLAEPPVVNVPHHVHR